MDPIGWWTDPFEIMVIGFVTFSLAFHGFMFLLKAAVLTVEMFYHTFYTFSPGLWTANILEWDWWGAPHNLNVSSIPRMPDTRCRHDPDPVATELLRPDPLVCRTHG